MDSRIANARALGFAFFATGAWMYSMALADWFPQDVLASPTLDMVAIATMLGLLIAALASFLRTDHWAAFFFMFWSAIWWGVHGGAGTMVEGTTAYAGWFSATIAVVSIILFLAAMRDPETLPVRLVSLGIALAFVSWALAQWGVAEFFVRLAGYIALLSALASYWAAAAEALGGEAGTGGAKATTPPAGGAM